MTTDPRTHRARRRWPTAVLAAASLTAVGLLAAPAQAQVVQCAGSQQNTTIHGTVLVPDGAACELINVMVIGDAEVGVGADLFLDNTAVRAVTAGDNAFVSATDSMMSGLVTLNQSFGLQAMDSFIHGGVVVNGGGTPGDSLVFGEGTHIVGNVQSGFGWTVLRDGQINGRLDAGGDLATDLFRMRIHGVRINDADTGSVVCDSTSHGDVSVTFSHGVIQLGGPFPIPACAGNKIVGHLTVRDNIADEIQISGNTIMKDLLCSGNKPAPVGHGNIVLGTASGQCENIGKVQQGLIPPPGAPGEEEAATEGERVDKVLTRLASRTATARTKLAAVPAE